MPDSVSDVTSKETSNIGDSPIGKYDCHSIVKSSGLTAKKRLCCEHGHKCLKISKATVACQTDPNENDLDFKNFLMDPFERNPFDDCFATNASFDQQMVAPDMCHAKQDGDGSKPEGVLRMLVPNFREMSDTKRGPAKLVSGVPWKIMVMPRQHVVAKKGTQKCLGFFLQCCPESYSDSWSCQAAAELRLISQKPGVQNFVRKTNHIYTAKENDWGYSCFMTWADILDESQGYMKDENVILEVYVRAESPKGILTYEAFCKKIQDYMRLSDMQCSRNLIDKALEVNQTAVKFCKDKDDVMKEELEKQKTRLIERKLMQSIERIEKDSKTVDNFESGTNLNNLRQALAGNLAAYKNAAGVGQAKTTASPATGTQTPNATVPQLPVKESNNGGVKTKLKNKSNNMENIDASKTPAAADIAEPKMTPSDDGTIITSTNISAAEADRRQSAPVGDALTSAAEALSLSAAVKSLSLPPRRRSTAGPGAVGLFDLDEPCCSDRSDDGEDDDELDDNDEDESDYEDIDEVCDGCLVERLDNMSAGNMATTTVAIDAQDMWCQTDFQPSGAPSLPLLGRQPFGVLPVCKSDASANKISPLALKSIKHKLSSEHQSCGMGKTIVNNLTQNDNDELLKLITHESKASLNTIKDTLERLLSHDAGTGDTLLADAPLPFDLAGQLQQQLNVSAAAGAAAAAAVVKNDAADLGQQTLLNRDVLADATATTTVTSTTTNAVLTMAATTQPPQPTQTAQSVIVKKTLQQQQQLIDVNQQMVQIKQIVELKRQQQQQQQIYRELSAAAAVQQRLEDEATAEQQQILKQQQAVQAQQQQFVQTDLSYVPRTTSPITEEDYSLLRHAKEIVENRVGVGADDFCRHTQQQIIEKSEYDRLAETVKKVEKRMRDIEKQTMTCRKQLADENERNYREEQKLIKNNKQLKQQLDQANEKIEKLNAQLRERRTEIKKIEKKLKAECQTSAENAELNSRLEQVERDLNHARSKHTEDKQRLTDENQRLTDIKKSLQQELSCATNEIERLHAQLEDATNHLKKIEATYKQERHQAQTSLKEASDRAKKAEINLLEFKLEMFSKTLQRSYDECKNHIGQLEELLKRVTREQPTEDFKWLQGYVQDWHKVKDKIHDTLQKMKSDFVQQIESVKCGKSLTSLPLLDLPKPIPFPPTPKQFHALIHEPRQPIAPIGVHPGASTLAAPGSVSATGKNRSFSPNQPGVMVNGVVSGVAKPLQLPAGVNGPQQQQSVASNVTNTAAGGGPASTGDSQSASGCESSTISGHYGPSGGSVASTTSSSGAPSVTAASSAAPSAPGHMTSQLASASAAPVPQARHDFSPWSDPLHGLTQSLFGNKPIATVFDAFPSAAPPAAKAPLLQHPAAAAAAAAVGQWTTGGWAATFSTPPPPIFARQQPPTMDAVNGGQQTADEFMRSRSQVDANSPQPSLETTMDSPISSDKSKQVDVVGEQLRSVFPHLSPEIIRDCINEFRSMQYNRTLKGLTGEQLFNGVMNIICVRHKPQTSSCWPVPPNITYQMVPSDAPPPMGQYGVPHFDQLCTLCGHGIRSVDLCTLNCSHTFHNNCITPWLAKKPSCPICCAYTVPSEEFPDLA